jgi:polysaccharide pyruvyl transferase WcaK-like protein
LKKPLEDRALRRLIPGRKYPRQLILGHLQHSVGNPRSGFYFAQDKVARHAFGRNDNMKMHESKRRKIAFFGHFDSTNFGNESTLQAILHHLRCYQPEAEVTCISTGPRAVVASYQIEVIPISDNLLFKSWLPRNPLLRVVRRVFIGIPSEPFRWIYGLMRLRHTDVLIIPGTGLLSDAYGLAGWGPYSLFRWSLTAKICRCKLLFVSVGAGPIYGALGRWFVKSALSLADYRSYRDNSTMQYLNGIGFRAENDRVYPDLAFSLPEAVIRRQHDNNSRTTVAGRRTVVGLGLMEYAGKDRVSRSNNEVYLAYLENLVVFVGWLLAQGSGVRLLFGDRNDLRTIQEFRGLLRERLSAYDENIIDEPIVSVDDLLSQIAATDVVVATRFHNVLLALLCNKPVIAISFHHKCESLMSAMGLSAYCVDINDLKADRLVDKICDLETNAAKLRPLIREKVREARSALDEQYKVIFNDMWIEQ